MFTIDTETNMITIVKKDTLDLTLTLDNYELFNGDTVYFTIASTVEQPEPLLQKVITSFDDAGAANISLSSEDMDLEIGSYLYDVQVNTADGRVDTVIGPAKFKVVGGVTY